MSVSLCSPNTAANNDGSNIINDDNSTQQAEIHQPLQEQQMGTQQLSNNIGNNNTSGQPMAQQLSFKKQPILSRISCHSAISSFIEPDHTLSQVSSANTSPKNLTTEQDFQLNYDEQIRAPRMSTLSKVNSIIRIAEHQPLGDCDFMHRNSDDSAMTTNNDEFSNTSRNTSATSNNSMDLPPLLNARHTSSEAVKQYCPATYDLSQPLRRFSSPSINSNNNGNNYKKSHHQQKQPTYADIAKKALHNLQTNTTSVESSFFKRNDPRERISTDGPIRQIDELKTPNYVPAVLRPPNYQSSNNTRKTSFSSLGEAYYSDDNKNSHSGASSPTSKSTLTKTSSYPSSSSNSTNTTLKFLELPRNHWVANNERTACSNCHAKFSLINRKHHCRKCGDIFCFNCCYIRASLNFKLHFDLMNGVVVKVCNGCGVQYNQYIRENFVNNPAAAAAVAASRNADGGDDKANELLEKERSGSSVAVPVDWNWSSF